MLLALGQDANTTLGGPLGTKGKGIREELTKVHSLTGPYSGTLSVARRPRRHSHAAQPAGTLSHRGSYNHDSEHSMTLSPSLPHDAPAMANPWPTTRLQGVPLPPPQRDPPLPPLPRPSLDASPPRPNDPRRIPRKPVPVPPPPVTAPVPAPASAPAPAPPIRPPARSRTDDPMLVEASQIPTDLIPTAPAPGPHRPRPSNRAPSHARSMSHPFPSLFATRKKTPPKSQAQDDFDSDSDSEAEMLGLGPGSKSKALVQPIVGSSHAKPMGDKDFASGNCMTCGALSRWPKGLRVFKCTLCVTINDLVDFKSAAEPQSHNTGRPAPPPIDTGRVGSKAPISLEITKRLIRDSLRIYLSSALGIRRPSIDSRERGSMEQSRPGGSNWRSQNEGDPAVVTPTIEVSESEAAGAQHGTDYLDFPRSGPMSQRSQSSSYPEGRPTVRLVNASPAEQERGCADPDGKRLFRPLEDYIINCFAPPLHCVNKSFMQRVPRSSSRRIPPPPKRRPSDSRPPESRPPEPSRPSESRRDAPTQEPAVPALDAKLLLLGDFAENGSWWTGRKEEAVPVRSSSHRDEDISIVTNRSPNIDWADLDAWYYSVINAGESWEQVYQELVATGPSATPTEADLSRFEEEVIEAQEHLRKTLLKVTENLLKRPGRPIKSPEDLRFLLIVSANPLLHSSFETFAGRYIRPEDGHSVGAFAPGPPRGNGPVSGQHSPIIKRILGLLSNTPTECHNYLISWFSRLSEPRFVQLKDFAGGFMAYRLIRQNEKKFEMKVDVTAGLIPQLAAGRTPAQLHDALGQSQRAKKKKAAKETPKKLVYHDDWQTKAAARVLGFLFAANNSNHRRPSTAMLSSQEEVLNSSVKDQVHARGQIVPTSDFYTSLLDDSDLVADFEAWEHKKSKFSFCQFPFLLSIWAKIQILEHDAKRQMHIKARDAFFDSILSRRTIEQYLTLNVRRDCLVEDSLKSVSEVIGSGSEDIKKGLRIAFQGEEGVDAGGLKKEWFLLLVREVFNPDHGMFVYDEDSQYCYFNPNSFETSDQYFLVGVVFGLAIYNSIILDVAFPPFAFRKLLTAAPPPPMGLVTQPRPVMSYSLGDLAEFRPRLAKGLRQLLDFDGDVESTFCLDFVIQVEKYGYIDRIPLCPGGDHRPVTNSNRREYVDLYVRYLLDAAINRQFEPFKRGFFTVCGGNALSLFRPEEIELLVRGSDEPLDVKALKVSAEYENWGKRPHPEQYEPTLHWFWQSFETATPKDQRRLLAFITGSDRIPAMGAASLTIKISCLGDDIGRYPTARTCFNHLQLWRYRSQEQLQRLLWGAVHESEGFGLK